MFTGNIYIYIFANREFIWLENQLLEAYSQLSNENKFTFYSKKFKINFSVTISCFI